MNLNNHMNPIYRDHTVRLLHLTADVFVYKPS